MRGDSKTINLFCFLLTLAFFEDKKNFVFVVLLRMFSKHSALLAQKPAILVTYQIIFF